jgi:hypothetical protein
VSAGTVQEGKAGGSRIRVALWSAAAALLVAPAVAMRFTAEVNWTASDFVFAAVVFGSVGLFAEAAVRISRNPAYRAGAAFALLAGFMTVWANLAVGLVGNEDNPYNLAFFGVVALALAGAAASRFRAGGMALTTLAAGVAQAGLALGGASADPRGALFSAAFAGLWLLSAALFRTAARAAAK